MKQILLFSFAFLFTTIQCAPAVDASNFPDWYLMNLFEEMRTLLLPQLNNGRHLNVSELNTLKLSFYLSETNFCPSIITSKMLASRYSSLGKDENLDMCCRSAYECESIQLKRFEPKIWSCECEYSFRKCLQNLNNELAHDFGYVYSLNTKECYSADYRIKNCIKYETILKPKIKFQGSPNSEDRQMNSYRCIQYELDYENFKFYQRFDLPFNYDGLPDDDIKELDSIKVGYLKLLIMADKFNKKVDTNSIISISEMAERKNRTKKIVF